jgi:HAD superfamily hydrolase (TIGR01509 family)
MCLTDDQSSIAPKVSDASVSLPKLTSQAFIFDLDGVIVNSELVWHRYARNFRIELYGEEVLRKLGNSMIGASLKGEYEIATRVGFALERNAFFERYERQAADIYARATVTPGLDHLVEELRFSRFRIGIVTASRPSWIGYALQKVPFRDQFEYVLSLEERTDLRHKPFPDGYFDAMAQLESRPETTLVLEDSNTGIRAAKAAGALTIGFRQDLVPGYEQTRADLYADTMADVVRIDREFTGTGR